MKAQTALLLLHATTAAATIFDTLFPSAEPTVTEDPRECLFSDFYPYWSAVTPTGALSTALVSYGDVLQKDCEWVETDILGIPTCTYPALADWCSFSDAVPKTLLPAWSSYASSASAWWQENKQDIVEGARDCPNRWFNQMLIVPYAYVRLNNTISWGACYARAHAEANPTAQLKAPKTPSPSPAPAPLPSATNGQGASVTHSQATSTAGTDTDSENFALVLGADLWFAIRMMLVAVAVGYGL
ncbi:hypothetical protein ACHAPJ_004226 [Fusarium lateritium]